MSDEAWIDTVRLARDFGTIRELFPDWVVDVRDLPYPLFDAIRQAETVLSWEENLPEDEMPPKRIWDEPEALQEWFAEVKRKRDRQAKGEDKDIEDPVDNEAAKALIAG